MNSISKEYYDPCKKERKEEEKHCPTIVKCGCPSSTTLPIATPVGTTFTLASLTLDTSCLCDPSIKLEFASNVVIPVAASGAVSIQIFKQCRGQVAPVPVGPAWTWSELVAVAKASTFSFFVCDSDSCFDDCCTYTAVATVTTVIAGGTISFNNNTLGAVATCKSNNCKKECHRRHERKCHCDRDCD
jgi:hypothetical protein